MLFESKNNKMMNQIRNLILISIFTCCGLISYSQTHHFDSLSNINYFNLHNANLNDCWGYVDELGNEYALVGTTKGTSVVSLDDPANPVEVFWIPGTESIWRDLQVYEDYAYITTEADDGLVIIDLSPLPFSNVLPTYTYFGAAGPSYWSSAHDIFIDTTGGWAYICGANRGNGGMIILDIHTNPIAPIEVGVFDDWYCHDAFAQGNLLYGAHISAGYLSIIDVTDHANPVLINTTTTPNSFTHNVWVTSNDTYAVTTDEIRGAYVTIYDVSDPMNIQETDRVQSTFDSPIIPHNAFILRDSFIVTSYYTDGIVMHNMTRPNNVIEVATYDSHPLASGVFDGSWGVYPFLPSGLFLASDMTTGLHVVKPTNFSASYLEGLVRDASNLNPLNGAKVEIIGEEDFDFSALDGSFATGTPNFGVLQVKVSKTAYFDLQIAVNFAANLLIIDTFDLVPIPPTPIQINVVEAGSLTPIIGANVLVEVPQMSVESLTNGFGEAAMNIYYPGSNLVSVGKWGYVTKCSQLTINSGGPVITIELQKGYYDDFVFDNSWSTVATAQTGLWERAVPFEGFTTVSPEVDAFFDCGNQCYITGNASTYSANIDDVHDGEVKLISPVMDLTNYTSPYLNFEYWFYNYFGPLAVDDTLRVLVSNGVLSVEVFKEGNTGTIQNWKYKSVLISDFLPITSTMRVTFQTSDLDSNVNITEAAIDYFSINNLPTAATTETSINSFDLELFPNPVSDKLNMKSKFIGQVQLFNSMGVLILTVQKETELIEIDINNLDSGLYFIRAESESKAFVK